MTRRLLLLALAVLATAAAASPAHALTVGMADQQAASFSDGRLQRLGLGYARYVVPWNAATAQPAKVRAWLDATARLGMQPHIAFEHSAGDRCPSRPCTAPTRAQFRHSIDQFIAMFPEVRTYTTWNEGNHTLQPTRNTPALAAGYYQELVAACPGCTIVAGDVLDSGGFSNWIRTFMAALPSPPQLWGLHSWGDARDGGSTGVDTMLSNVPGTLWIEETGAMVGLRNSFGRQTVDLDEDETSAPIADAFTIARARPRIGRMYIYQWVGGSARFDSGLTDGSGGLRPSYYELLRQLGLAAAKTVTPRSATWTAAWSHVKQRRLIVRGTCPTAGSRCRGTLTATIRVRSKSGQVVVRRKLRTARYATAGAARRVTWRLTVPKSVRAAALRKGATRAVILRVQATQPTTRTSTKTIALKKPARASRSGARRRA
ncbi:MAG: hypothetical protein JHC95_17000 [Solirubrobacteraceae bacterium]|nr:hypothetical protein [Solirubrobacteraceae bacterium]